MDNNIRALWGAELVYAQSPPLPAIHTGLYPYGRAATSRTVNDRTGTYPWQYVLSPTTLFGFQTKVTDPLNNDSVHIQSAVSGASCALYETELDQYNGPQSQGNLLKKTITCRTLYCYLLRQPKRES